MYRIINIPEYSTIIAELRQYVFNNIDAYTDSFNHGNLSKLLKECKITTTWFVKNKLIPKVAAIIVTNPNTLLPPHVDTQTTDLALNFGIYNTTNTYTGLYKILSGNKIIRKLDNGLEYVDFENAEFEEIGRFNLDQPVLFNTKVPHSVNNGTNDKRISISFRFYNDPWEMLKK